MLGSARKQAFSETTCHAHETWNWLEAAEKKSKVETSWNKLKQVEKSNYVQVIRNFQTWNRRGSLPKT